ncbi:MAG TPA: hypothetical protein VF131_12320 [Blastocatellia bacterium]|nr:hypothetical protein [Blastocatellia bacterium]
MNIQNVLLNLKAVSAGAFARPALIFWFVAIAVVGPFVLLTIGGREANDLPWYFWALAMLLLALVITVGFLRFTRKPHEAEDISINPDRR